MKLRHKFALPIVVACLCFTASLAQATVTLQFSQIGVGRATGFSNSAGLVGINGMSWGVVVDTAANNLLGAGPTPAQMYDAASFNFSIGGFLTVNNVITDDYFFPSPTTTAFLGGTGGDVGGDGGITALAGVPFGNVGSITNTIDTGDPFGIVWFPTTIDIGNPYGLLQNQAVAAQFDIPSDGATTSFASTYFTTTNPDVIKAANLIMQGVPEPSRLILLGVGAMGLLLRRRRS